MRGRVGQFVQVGYEWPRLVDDYLTVLLVGQPRYSGQVVIALFQVVGQLQQCILTGADDHVVYIWLGQCLLRQHRGVDITPDDLDIRKELLELKGLLYGVAYVGPGEH